MIFLIIWKRKILIRDMVKPKFFRRMKSMGRYDININSFKKIGEFVSILILEIEEDDLNLLISSGQNKAGLTHFMGFSIRYYGLD